MIVNRTNAAAIVDARFDTEHEDDDDDDEPGHQLVTVQQSHVGLEKVCNNHAQQHLI